MKTIILTLLASILLVPQVLGEQFTPSFNTRTTGTITAEELNKHLRGVLKDKGEVFIRAEETYGVNAGFLAAIACNESGWGTSARARRLNECFGMLGCRFSSVDENIMAAAKNIAEGKYYYAKGHHTIERIGRVYAPIHHSKNNRRWIPNVISIMNKIHNS